MTGPSKTQLDHSYRMRKLVLIQKLGLYAAIASVAVIGFHYVYLSIRELAGKQTGASVLLSIYGLLKAPKAVAIALAWLLAGLASAWGYGERRGKKRAIERLHPGASQAQRQLDPNKGSSKITLRGNTGPDDL